MIRRATPEDLPALLDFLRPRCATSLFLSANLNDHGLNASGHPKATTVWIVKEADEVKAIIGCSKRGFVNCEAPTINPDWSPDLRRLMAGRRVIGMSGEVGQITNLRKALGLTSRPASFEDVEPHFLLDLVDLIVPPGTSQLRQATRTDLPLVTEWRILYDREVFGDADTAEMRQQSATRAEEIVQSGHLHLLEQDGHPVAMTGFNAALPEIVQIGSVFTPAPRRAQGNARRAVALHLAKARDKGVKSAVLFAVSPAAVRAYQSIGFVQIGDYSQIVFADPIILGDPV